MGKLLALDVGERRVGVAVCDAFGMLARPLVTIVRRSKRQDFERIERLVQEHGAEAVLVGHPINMDGSEGPQARHTSRYASALGRAISVPVLLWDERLSSEEARLRLREAGNRRQGQPIDAAAAAVFLQEYLDSLREGQRSESQGV
jgi:putative Holliday junction resolvase